MNVDLPLIKSLLLYVITLVISTPMLYAQPTKKPQFNKWVFGNNNMLDFSSGRPVHSKFGKNTTIETAGAHCDPNGDLLLYSDGKFIYDKNDDVIQNGEVWSSQSARQGPIFVPFIDNPRKFYVFQVDGSSATFTLPWCGPAKRYDGLYYHVIDMTLNGGKGGIVPGEKNNVLVDTTGEAVIGIMHDNGVDYWIVTRKALSSTFYAFLVTKDGICPTPVISEVGSGNFAPRPAPGQVTAPGNLAKGLMQMKASFDGTQIATVESYNRPQLFDFNQCTGKLSNMKYIDNSNGGYDICFSPNDSLIYISKENYLNQYKRFDDNIPSTRFYVGSGKHYGMRVYGDSLYIATAGVNNYFISLLSSPDIYQKPGLQNEFMDTDSNLVSYNFPHYFDYERNGLPYNSSKETYGICIGDSVIIQVASTLCSDTDFIYSWSPASDLSDASAANPVASPQSSTTYIRTATYLCHTYTDTVVVMVAPKDSAEIMYDNAFCKNDVNPLPTILGNTDGFFAISGNGIIDSLTGEINLSETEVGVHTVFYELNSACLSMDSTTLTINSVPFVDAGEDIILNVNDISTELSAIVTDSSGLVLNNTNSGTYEWSPSEGLSCTDCPVTICSPPLNGSDIVYNYIVTYTDGNGCSASDDVNVTLEFDKYIYVPNGFTPNADGSNDEFGISSNGVADIWLTIYDSKGKKVFETENIEDKWNGMFNNRLINGTLTYQLIGSYIGDIENNFIQTGTITVLK